MKKILRDIDKKFLVSLLIIITLLSTVAIYQIHAAITAEMDSMGLPENAVPEAGRYITLADMRTKYDILCCYHGGDDTHIPNNKNVILRANGKSTTVTDSGKVIGELIKGNEGEKALTVIEDEIHESTPYTNESYYAESFGFYQIVETHIARPKEAYILSEMIGELDGETVFYEYSYDNAGNKVEYTDLANIESANSFQMGESTLYLVDKEYVAELPDGDLVKVEEVSDGNGGTYYRYKSGSYRNGFVQYEGNVTWNGESEIDGREFPSFYVENSLVEANNAEAKGGKIVANGVKMYATASKAVEYDEATQKYYNVRLSSTNSYVQIAWWTTIAGSKGMIVPPDNSLALEATAFEAYISQLTNVDTSTFEEQHYEFQIEGNTHEGNVPAPVFTYEPMWNEDANQDGDVNEYDKVTTSWDGTYEKQSYTIGPFSINYIEEAYKAEGREEVIFAGITDAKLYTNLGEVSKENWRFIFINDERDETDTFEFPHANEVFYVELDYIEGATKVTNLHFDFKYMNAGGKYDELEGKYFQQTWTPDSEAIATCPGGCGHSEHTDEMECDGKCEHGYRSSHTTKWKYWLELTGMEEKRAQLLGYGIIGARWYKYTELNIEGGTLPEEHEGSIRIVKQIVDENGNELTDIDNTRKFTFEIYKDGELYDTVQVSPNRPYTSSVFRWKDGENAPEFNVVEILDDEDYEQYGSIETAGNIVDGVLTFTAKNKAVKKEGRVSIQKVQLGTGLEDQEFSFKLYIDNKVYIDENLTSEDGTITIKVGETWNSNTITWTGDSPSYKVTEINLPEGAKLVNMENDTGLLMNGKTVNVKAINESISKDEPEYEKGALIVKKLLDGNVSSNESFNFVIKVGDSTYEKSLKAGQTWSETFIWEKGTKAPDYEVSEVNIPEGFKLVEIKNAKGTLSSDSTGVEVVCINEVEEEQKGTISIHKETISDDKEGVDEQDNIFTFVTRISGTFEMSGESIVNGTKTITSTLKSGDTIVLDEITWKGEAPTYTVSETEIPEGWSQESITNASGTVKANETIEVKCVNRYRIIVEYALTMEMSGLVWEDKPLNEEDKNTEASKPNGKYDNSSEVGIEKVEVVIWKKLYNSDGKEMQNLRKHATGYEEGTETQIEFPIYTSVDGYWEAPRMVVPALSEEEKAQGAVSAVYDVEFIYDGQTYKPTDFLVSGTAEEFRKASNADKSKYLNDSMACETESDRAEFDSKFEVITGDTPIDENGVTVGYASNGNGQVTVEELIYNSTDSMPSVDNNTRKISELQTTENGYVIETYKISSRTSTGALTYPFDDKVHLENVKKIVDKLEGGLTIRYEYSATYPYLLNVNLGLVRRDEAEMAITKDVHSAAVVVNQKLLNYKYNEYVDFESVQYQDYLNLQLQIADADISYKLDLYESDYYYRAKVYETNAEVNGALQEFYKSIGKTDLSDELDLDVFLTYKISVYNNSDSYLAQIRNIVDYFDEDLELVTAEQTKYIQEANGVTVDSTTVVASPAYVIKKGPTQTSMWGEVLNKSIANNVIVDYGKTYTNNIVNSEDTQIEISDNVKPENTKLYNKANIGLQDAELSLAAGEKLEVYLTFKVKTDETPAEFTGEALADNVDSYVRLGNKANIAEIGSYSTYYPDGKIAGKVDKDSAPNNVDIENKNEKSWYEDDTDSAPIITLDLYSEARNVSGLAWEDKETENIDYNQRIGNGIYDEGERLIGNLTTQMVEKVRVKQADSTYKEYDFVWPTSEQYDFLNNKALEEITGFDSITLTSNAPENTGEYKFTNVPAGNYVVRFVYGYFPSDSMDENGNLVKLEGVSEPKTSDDDSRLPAVYNGQDFKTTTYQVDNVGDDGKSDYVLNDNGYINNEWHDFSTCKYDENGNIITHNSDAIDNEARRLEVIAYSKVLTNENTKVLATANSYTEDHTELYKQTAMFADTAKINLNIENMQNLAGQKIVITNEITGQTQEVYAGEELTRNGLISNSVYGKSNVSGEKGTISVIKYDYNIEAIDIGIEERSNTELVLDKEIESIELKTNTGATILKAVYDINYEYTLDEDTGKTKYEAKVELNKDASYGTNNLLAQNKDEEAGLQNFRYINYDDSISQGLNLEVVYRFTALNVGEVDRTGKVSEMSSEEILAKANELKDQVYVREGDTFKNINHLNVGEYVGSIYYLGKREAYTQNDTIVTTKVRQLIDYVDNDAVFKASDNIELDSSWKTVTAEELLDNKVIESTIIGEYDGVKNIVDDKDVVYTTSEKNNLVLSVDKTDGEKLSNPGFIVDIVPFAASKENSDLESAEASCMSSMKLVMTRSIDSQIDDEDLSYDNIAEIVKFENTVGKRDIETIAGNSDPKLGEFTASLEERDSSATELITFTPPTGLGTQTSLTIEILIVTLVALAIVLIGVIIIKKTVLKK